MHYTYDLSYNPLTVQVLEFVQEKLTGDRLPDSKKVSAAYSNLYRAIDCIEQKLNDSESEIDGEEDTDVTQQGCDI